MEKPIALSRAESTRGSQVENAKMKSKKTPPEHGNQNMYMSMVKPIALNRAEGTRGPQIEKRKNDVNKKLGMGDRWDVLHVLIIISS